MRKTWNIVLAMWRPILFSALALIALLALMFWQLGSLTPGLSQEELETYQETRSLSAIIEAGVNAPYKTAVFVSTKVANNTFGLRAVGATLGIATILIFFMLARRLLKDASALIATGMFASSGLLLAVSRQATVNVMLLSLLAVIAVGYMIRFDKMQAPAWIFAAVVIGLSLYVPGMAVFILIAVAWQFKQCRRSFEALSPIIIIVTSVLLSILVAPLVISLIRQPELWRAYLGLPESLGTIQEMAKAALQAVGSFFFISPKNPTYWLGRQPILGIAASGLFVYGIIAIARRFRLDRFWILAGVFVLTLLWIAVATNLMLMVVALPFVYVVIGFGVQRLVSQWHSVFPRNPIAQTVGYSLVGIVVLLSVNFQLRRYFVAWPNNDDTKAVYNIPHPVDPAS